MYARKCQNKVTQKGMVQVTPGNLMLSKRYELTDLLNNDT